MNSIKLLTLFILSGFHSCAQQGYNSTAKQFTDSAFKIFKTTGDPTKALPLLDQALNIDSNYVPALSSKFSFEMASKMLDKALLTGQSLIRIKPNVGEYYSALGIIYEQKQDSISSRKCFIIAIACYDKKLDTMSKENRNYDAILLNKAFNLILVGQQKYGNDILKQLFDESSDENYKEIIKSFMNKTKQQILADMK